MKKVVIIGGGITSCVIAFFLNEAGHKVVIYEKNKKLGGILNDFENKGQIFLNSCKYLNVNNSWFNKIKKVFYDDLILFNQKYGTHLVDGKFEISTNKFAIPVFDNINELDLLKKLENVNNNILSVDDRIRLYPKNVEKFIRKIFLIYNLDVSELSFETLYSFQMTRVAFLKNKKKIYELKSKDKKIDDLIALDRNKIFSTPQISSSLPKNGYNKFFLKIYEYLEKKGVKIITDTRIEPLWDNNELKIFNKNEEIKNNLIIWTGNPTKLIRTFNSKRLDSKYSKIIQYNSNVIYSKNFKNIYIQNFSYNSNLIRINLYKINNQKKMSVETIFTKKKLNNHDVLNEALKILNKFNIHLKLDKESFSNNLDIRFNILSLKDKNIIEDFNKKTLNSNLNNGAWLQYGTDNKIKFILKNLKDRQYL